MIAGIGLAATIGAGATAQLGAMRINEEIDALEVMGIRSIAYLASNRVVAGVVVVIPLYCVAVLTSFLAARVGTTAIYGQSSGVYDHYFNTILNPTDIIWSSFRRSRWRSSSCLCTPTTGLPRRVDPRGWGRPSVVRYARR